MSRRFVNVTQGRGIAVPVLVIEAFLIATTVGAAVGVERPYPGVALGSGLLLVLERAAAVWAFVLLALVVVAQALRGRLPDEIGGRGVRYVAEEQLADVADMNDDVVARLDKLEAAFEAFELRTDRV